MSADYRDMLCLLKSANVEFMVIGAYALGAHGIVRGTQDMDIWVRPGVENARRLWRALVDFGAPMDQMRIDDFEKPRYIIQIGVAPNRIDLCTAVTGIDFDEAWGNKVEGEIVGVRVWVLSREDIIRNKSATNRDKDRHDLKLLRDGKTLG